MKKLLFVLGIFVSNLGFSQTSVEAILNKYLEVTKIKTGAASITDISMSMTTESARGVAETEIKYAFPYKYSMNVYANGMTVMNSAFNGETSKTVMGFGGQSPEPKTGIAAKNDAYKSHPFLELIYSENGFTATLLADEGEHHVIEFKDSDGKSIKNYYNKSTGFKDKIWSKTESPRGTFESTAILENYKTFKGSEILIPALRKQTTGMGEITSEVQTVKFNKGLKDKDFEIK
jgi:hypothetical protein